MYVFESKNHRTLETDSIIGKSIIEICGSILNYTNGKEDNSNNDYTVSFIDKNGKVILEVLEDSINYSIFDILEDKSKEFIIKNEAIKFMEIIHTEVEIIEFTNPIRSGEVYWDVEYDDYESDVSDDSYERNF